MDKADKVKIIKVTGQHMQPDDPSLPFKLELSLRPPEFMIVAFVLLHGGTEDVVARAATLGDLTEWMDENKLKTHIRLSRYTITDGDGKVVDSFDRHARTAVVA